MLLLRYGVERTMVFESQRITASPLVDAVKVREQQGRFLRYMERNAENFIAKRDCENERLAPPTVAVPVALEIADELGAEEEPEEGGGEAERREKLMPKPLPRLLETNDVWLHVTHA